MKTIAMVRAELVKLRHTSYWYIHTIIPILGAALFVLYFTLYKNVDEYQRLSFILELTAMIFPLMIGVIVGLIILQEEKASHFQIMLGVSKRWNVIFAKLLVLYLSGIFSLIMMFILFAVGIKFEQISNVPWLLLLQAVLGLGACNLIIYIVHLLLSLKLGLGASMIWGVFECLQCILYSNIELHGVWWYIPFAWPIHWIQDVFLGKIFEHGGRWIVVMVLTFLFFFVLIYWFSKWEGRKNYE